MCPAIVMLNTMCPNCALLGPQPTHRQPPQRSDLDFYGAREENRTPDLLITRDRPGIQARPLASVCAGQPPARTSADDYRRLRDAPEMRPPAMSRSARYVASSSDGAGMRD